MIVTIVIPTFFDRAGLGKLIFNINDWEIIIRYNIILIEYFPLL